MIPFVARLEVRRGRHRGFRLWIPLFLLWLLLLPVVLLLLPLAFVACLAVRMNPFRVLADLWRVLTALAGTHVELEDHNSAVSIHVF